MLISAIRSFSSESVLLLNLCLSLIAHSTAAALRFLLSKKNAARLMKASATMPAPTPMPTSAPRLKPDCGGGVDVGNAVLDVEADEIGSAVFDMDAVLVVDDAGEVVGMIDVAVVLLDE